MSIDAMNWVWTRRLRPSIKFVLLALADAADDNGICWPSIPTLANKTCLDDRSVQRILSNVKRDGLLDVERRYRKDGTPTSNRYRLTMQIGGGDKTPPPTIPVVCQDVVAEVSPDDDTSATQTTTEPSIESKPPQPSTSRGGGDLIFPKQLSQKEISIAGQRLIGLSPELAQEILDELAARLSSGQIRGAPLSYLRTLVTRAKDGSFIAEAGIRVATAREQERERLLAKQAQPPGETLSREESKKRIEALRQTMVRTFKKQQESQRNG